jgi:hypothetical protein
VSGSVATQVGERGIRRASLTSIIERKVDPSVSANATLVPRTEPHKPAAPPPPAAKAVIDRPVNPKGSASGETEAEEKSDGDEDDTGTVMLQQGTRMLEEAKALEKRIRDSGEGSC